MVSRGEGGLAPRAVPVEGIDYLVHVEAFPLAKFGDEANLVLRREVVRDLPVRSFAFGELVFNSVTRIALMLAGRWGDFWWHAVGA